MKFILNILLVIVCCSALVFSKGVDDSSKKTVKTDASVMMGTIKYSQGYSEYAIDESIMERKRSHKRRKAVRKPRRGRGQ